jgi:hypothetical protein
MVERFARIPSQAVGCPELSARDWRVLACVALHADGSGRAYPSMATIASMTGIARGDVPRSIRRLVRLRLLSRQSRAGPSTVNIYTVIFDSREVSVSMLTGISTVADRVSASAPTECQQIRPEGVSIDADLTDHKQTEEQKRARRASRQRIDDDRDGATDDFETFWQIYPARYPHPNPKKPARLKFEAAVKRGADADEIIRGARNYAAYVAANVGNPRYVTQAVTWLNREQWAEYQDTPETPRLRVGMN